GHARVNLDSPLHSGFILASTHDSSGVYDPGFLSAEELYELRGVHARLRIMGHCNTTDGPVSSSEGLINLARPLLVAGVPAVIGSLWAVDDERGRQLMLELHRQLRAGNGAAEALQL